MTTVLNLNVSQLADEFHFSDPVTLVRFSKKQVWLLPNINELQREYMNRNFIFGKMNSYLRYLFLNNYIFRHKGSFYSP